MKINLLPKKKAVWNATYKSFHIIALFAIVFNMSSVGIFLTPNTASAASLTATTGAVCPDGNVKYEIGSGYAYNDGSATITGDGDSVSWTATAGYTITGVCIKIGGPGGGSLIDPNPADGSAGPFAYDISHVVVTTDQTDTGNLRIKKYHDLNRDGSKNGSDYYLKGWYFEVTQGGVLVGNGWTGEDGNYLIIEDLPVGDYQVTETQQPGWINSDPGVSPITKTVTVIDEDTTYHTNVWFGNYSVGGLNDLLSDEGVCDIDEWGYNTAAAGVGLENQSSGTINLNVPENLHKAYIFWGGRYEYESGTPGDNEIKLNGTVVTADGANVEKGTNPLGWGWVGYYADVTSLVTVGNNAYTVSEVDVHSNQNDGAGIIAVYKDSTKNPSEFMIKGGLDYAFHGFPNPMGNDTQVYTYTFDPAPYPRTADTSLLVGDGEAGTSRGDNLWFQSGTGSAPTDLVDQAGASEIATNFMVQSDGPQWDTFSTTVTIPANATYASFQIESPSDQNGESIAWHAQSFVLGQDCPEEPGECELEILKTVTNLTQSTPGNPDVSANPGDIVEYTLAYENVGNGDCTGTGVKLYDDLDSRLTYNGNHSEDNDDHDITYEGNYNGTNPVANAHVVSPGESGYVTFEAVVTEDLECGETIIPNEYRIWSNETGDIWSNEVNVDVNKECFGTLRIKKFYDTNENGVRDAGEQLLPGWHFTVSQGGSYVTDGVTDGNGILYVYDLPAGSYDITETLQAGWINTTPLTQSRTVVINQTATVYFGNVEVEEEVCDLEIVKSVSNLTQSTPGNPDVSANPGDIVEYTLAYENVGNGDCTGTGVKLYDDLDDRLSYNGHYSTDVQGDTDGQGITYQGNYNGTDPVANAHVVSPGESGYVTFQAIVTEDLECGETIIPNEYRIWSNEDEEWSNEVNVDVNKECYGSLKVIKYVDEGDATPDMWDFTVAGHGTQSPAQGTNYVIFSQLSEGDYTATESYVSGYHQVSTTCNDVSVVAEQQSVCEFHNTVDHYDFGGYKWDDLNGNGEWDDGEPALEGWTIKLVPSCSENFSDYDLSPDDVLNLSDLALFAQLYGQNDLAVDLDSDGLVDEDDFNCFKDAYGSTPDTLPTYSVETGKDGSYKFTDMLPGVYQVCEEQQEGWNQTYPSENDGCHYVFTGPNSDVKKMNYNFGNTAEGKISGYKFEDLNANSEWNDGELGLENWTIELQSSCSEVFADYDLVPDDVINLSDLVLFAQKYGLNETVADLNADGEVNHLDFNCFKDVYGATPGSMPAKSVMTTLTDANGYYEFTGLEVGAYYVSEVMQDGWIQTLPDGNGIYGPLVITSGAMHMDKNFGNFVPVVEVPDISLVKEITDHDLVPGGFVEYKLTYANTGNVDLTNVYIVDDYPEEYLTISDTGGATDGGTTLTWTIGDLAIGGTGTVSYTAAIRDTAPANVDIINIATIYSDQTDPKEDDAVTLIPPVEETNPILQITKDVNVEYANPGDTVDYTVVVTNVGDATAINVILTDVLPEGLTYPEGGTTKTFSLGDIDPGDSVTQTYDAVVGESTEAGDYVNVATADADNHDPVSDDATVEVRLPIVKGDETAPELEITKEVDVEFANPGDTISYTVVVKNVGDGDAINVILTDTLPEGFVFDGTDEVVKVWQLGDMAPGDSKTITYAVNVKDDVTPGMYENLAVVGADNATEKEAKVDVEVRAITVLGTTLPDTGTSLLDYLYYLIGIVTFIIGLWTLQHNMSKKADQKINLQRNGTIKL
jgi:uncharacterized repeat protein (TIGR01451 family)/fimbrial isopeptide formation D2 family protein